MNGICCFYIVILLALKSYSTSNKSVVILAFLRVSNSRDNWVKLQVSPVTQDRAGNPRHEIDFIPSSEK